MKNITLSADDFLIEKARTKARMENSSLNNRFREWLNAYVSHENKVQEYRNLMNNLSNVNSGKKYSREELNER